MKKKIGILSVGTGNLLSIKNCLNSFGVIAVKTQIFNVDDFDAIILPGVGSFEAVMKKILKKKINEKLYQFALVKKKPILGICLGMHLMMESSQEGSQTIEGLGWLKGNVCKNVYKKNSYLNVGWEYVSPCKKLQNKLLKKVITNYFYFDHSFSLEKKSEAVSALTRKKSIPALIVKKNLLGVQFHPEKSHDAGKIFIKYFLERFNLI